MFTDPHPGGVHSARVSQILTNREYPGKMQIAIDLKAPTRLQRQAAQVCDIKKYHQCKHLCRQVLRMRSKTQWGEGPSLEANWSNKKVKVTWKAFAISGLAVAGLTAPTETLAQDSFDSFYGAVEGGAGVVKLEGTTFLGPIDDEESSSLIGGALGVRWALGTDRRLVLGLETTADLYTDNSDWRYGVYGIGGLRVRDNDLAYLRVGYGELSSDLLDLDGMVLGAGYELALTDRSGLRLDYRSLFYGDTNFVDNSIDYSGHEITVAFVFHFWSNGR